MLVSLCFVKQNSFGQIAAWNFNGIGNTNTAGNGLDFAATTFDSHLVSTSGANKITRGSGAGWSTGSNSFRTVGFQNNGISVSNTDYFQITLAAVFGYNLSLSTIDANFNGTASYAISPGVAMQFAYSLDGTNFTLIGSVQNLIGQPAALTQIDLSGISALQNVAAGTTVYLRYYASGQTTTGGWGFYSVSSSSNGLAIGGSLTSVCSSPTITAISSNSICSNQTLSLSVITDTNSATPLFYTWTGAGAISSTNIANPTVTNVSGDYTVTVSNACGTASAVVTTTINASPNISVSSPTICAGEVASLAFSGATTYSVNGATTTTFNPATTATYAVIGASNNCISNSVTATISVNPLPIVSVNNVTICSGNSATLIPSGANTYTITGGTFTVNPVITTTYAVTGASLGCLSSNTAIATISVDVLPNFTVNPVSICSGGSATLTASGADTYSWNTGAVTNTISDAPAGTTGYTLTGTSLLGCQSSLTTSIIVTLSPSITVNSATICEGQTVTLTASGLNSYTWSANANGVNTGSVSVSPTTTTTYTIQGNALGCALTVSATTQVSVNTLPTISVNSSTICAGASTVLTAVGATSYSWSSGATTNTISANTNTTYIVTGTNAAGCSNTAQATVTVNPLPTITVNNATVCAGSSTILTANGATSYSWSSGATSNTISANTNTTYIVTGTNTAGCSNTAQATVTVNPLPNITVNNAAVCAGSSTILTANGATSYSWSSGATTNTISVNTNTTIVVTGTDASGCSNTAQATVTISPLPIVTVNDATLCAGSSTILTANGATSYSWSSGAATNTISANTNTTYIVTGTDAAGCSNTVQTTVTLNPLPSVTVISTSINVGATATLTANGANTYMWSTGANGSSLVVSPVATTNYTLIGTSLNGCTNSVVATVSVVVPPATQFLAGNVVVLQVGDGSAALSSSSTPVFLKEYSPIGVAGFSAAVPNGTNGLTNSGSATSEGYMTRSDDGHYLVLAGYNASVGISGIASSTSYSRAIATVDKTGSFSLAVTTGAFYSGNNIRGATADGNGNYYGSGTPSGVIYSDGSTTFTLENTVTNVRCVAINNGQLYFSTGSGTRGIYAAGVGVPTATTTATNIINTGSNSSPYAFYLNAAGNVCYIADDASIANGGGVQKWVNIAGTWSIVYTYTFQSRGLIADFSGSNPVIYATTTTNSLISIIDGGSVANSTISILATAPANTAFRGVAFSPTAQPCPPVITVNSASICAGNSVTLTASGANSYLWSTGATSASVSVSPTVTATYSVQGSNVGCATSSTIMTTVSVTPSPSISVNNASICPGETATLTASGATSYSWSSGAVTSSVSANTATIFIVTGTDAAGCTNTAQASVIINALPSLTVNPVSICSGGTTILTASGANTYSWNTGATTNTISDAPSITTTYTVTGTSLQGCESTATTSIIITITPSITVNSAVICAGQSVVLNASGVNTYTWSSNANGANTTSVSVSPTTGTTYTVQGNASGCVGTVSATAQVSVNQTPIINATASDICAGQTAFINSAGANTYTINGNPAGAIFTITPTQGTTYTVLGSNAFGCVDTTFVTLQVYPTPTITATGGQICQGSNFVIETSGANTYTVLPNLSTTVTPSSTTTYSVAGLSAEGCASNTVTLTVTVNSLPNLTVTASPSVVCATSSESLALSASGANTYTWNTGNNGSLVSITHPTVISNYFVNGTDVHGCVGAASITVMVDPCTGLEEHRNKNEQLRIYPNPNNGNFTVEVAENTHIVIMNSLGQVIHEETTSSTKTEVSLKEKANGIYFIKVVSGKQQQTVKVVKQD